MRLAFRVALFLAGGLLADATPAQGPPAKMLAPEYSWSIDRRPRTAHGADFGPAPTLAALPPALSSLPTWRLLSGWALRAPAGAAGPWETRVDWWEARGHGTTLVSPRDALPPGPGWHAVLLGLRWPGSAPSAGENAITGLSIGFPGAVGEPALPQAEATLSTLPTRLVRQCEQRSGRWEAGSPGQGPHIALRAGTQAALQGLAVRFDTPRRGPPREFSLLRDEQGLTLHWIERDGSVPSYDWTLAWCELR